MKINYIKYLLIFIAYIFLQSCTKKANTDEEIREMIIGKWSTKYKNRILVPGQYLIITFKENNKYDYWSEEGSGEDSTYYIENGEILFPTEYSDQGGVSTFISEEVEILRLTKNKLKIKEGFKNRNEKYTFKKI